MDVKELIKKFMPISLKASDVNGLIEACLIYVIAMVICGVIGFVLGGIPILGIIVKIVLWLIGLYLFAGLVVALLYYFKVLEL